MRSDRDQHGVQKAGSWSVRWREAGTLLGIGACMAFSCRGMLCGAPAGCALSCGGRPAALIGHSGWL